MTTPVPMPLTLGFCDSSGVKGQRLGEAAFFSLEMLTTLGCTFWTASTHGERREAAHDAGVGQAATSAAPTSTPLQSPFRRSPGSGTAVSPLARSRPPAAVASDQL
jgi:hypothetical protein